MKNIIITAIIIFSAFNLYAQTGKVAVIAKTNCSQAGKHIIDIMLQAKNAAEDINIADQNYRFSYNGEALSNPIIIAEDSDLKFNQLVTSGNGNQAFFSTPNLNGSQPEIVSLNIIMPGGNGYNLSSSTRTYICSVQFDVIDTSKPINFDWHEEDQFPETYMSSFNNNGLVKVYGVFNDDMDLANDITRTGMVVCTENDGSLRLDWPDQAYYYDLYVSMDGGQTFVNNPGEDEFTADNLPADDYDMRVKIGEDGCVTILDDININDLSHEVTTGWRQPTCGGSDGLIKLTWVKKVLPTIEISIDGGQSYVTRPAADELFIVDNLSKGSYDIRVKWSYAPFACPTNVRILNFGAIGSTETLTATYNCANRLTLKVDNIAPGSRHQFRYRTFAKGAWSAWVNSKQTTNGERIVTGLSNVAKAQVRVREICGGVWTGWSQAKAFNFSSTCKLGATTVNQIDVYPNPANQQVRVDVAGNIAEGSTVAIYSLTGKQMQLATLLPEQNSVQLNVEDLANGIYLIEVNTNDDKTHTQKLTIAH